MWQTGYMQLEELVFISANCVKAETLNRSACSRPNPTGALDPFSLLFLFPSPRRPRPYNPVAASARDTSLTSSTSSYDVPHSLSITLTHSNKPYEMRFASLFAGLAAFASIVAAQDVSDSVSSLEKRAQAKVYKNCVGNKQVAITFDDGGLELKFQRAR